MDIITYALLSKRLKAVEAIAGKLPIHICTNGEYDAETGQPTIQNPDVDTFYLVPSGTGTNLYTEWVYTGSAWEQFGSGSVPVDDVQVNGVSVVSGGVANITPGDLYITQTVTGTTPAITAISGIRYICGEVSTLDITLPASGCFDVVFESGSTPTVLTATGVTWPSWFDPTALEANTTYEISIADGFGAVMTWA